jgi:chromosome segregation ATPase
VNRPAKILILINTALSLMFVAWSFGLYKHAVPWTSLGEGDEKMIGQIDQLKEQIKGLTEARDKAEERWFAATREVLRLTQDVRARRNFYEEQIKMARTGTNLAGQQAKPPVQQLQNEGGLLSLKATGRPAVQIDGKDALSIAGYEAIIKQQLEDIRTTKMRINKVVDDTTALTIEINGTKPAEQAITSAEKGLRGQLLDANTLINNLELEQTYLQTPMTNFRVDLELHRRRQASLESRLKELTAGATALR